MTSLMVILGMIIVISNPQSNRQKLLLPKITPISMYEARVLRIVSKVTLLPCTITRFPVDGFPQD